MDNNIEQNERDAAVQNELLQKPIIHYLMDCHTRGMTEVMEDPGPYFRYLPIELQLNIIELRNSFHKLNYQIGWWSELYQIDMEKIESDIIDQQDKMKDAIRSESK